MKKMIKFIISTLKKFMYFYLPNCTKLLKGNISCKKIKSVNIKTRLTGKGIIDIEKNVNFGYKYGGYYYKNCIEIQARLSASHISIGKNTSFNNDVFICALKSITIGENCLIGHSVEIMDFDGHGVEKDQRRLTNGNVRGVKIKNNVWIGNNTTILKGTNIGENSIVGANSLVIGDFPSNCILAGNPAKIIRYL